MPGRISWYIKDYIFLVQIKGVVSDEEYVAYASNPILATGMDNSPALFVHYIFEVVDPKTTLPSLRMRGESQRYRHKKDGWAILVNFNINPFWRMTASILAQASRSRSRFVDNYAQGLDILRRVDPGVPQHDEPHIEWLFDINWEPSPVKTL